jgi:hypothetical protein
MKLALPTLSALALTAALAPADEGMWTFDNPPRAALRARYGFEPTAEWLEHLQKASVRFSTGGSGSIVSQNGLVMTNHHVGAEVLHQLSTPENDLLLNGFLAATPEAELACPDLELLALQEIVDVTERVEGVVPAGASAADAGAARRREMSAIEKESLEETGFKSDVVTLYQGGRYHLYRYARYTDVRLVFAPEKQAAFFGGDIDNFEYPRFDLDCTFFRIWKDGAPLQAEHHLSWSADGCAEGDLIFVAGHPGRTERVYTAEHFKYLRDVRYPAVMAYLWRREVQLKTFSERSEEWRRIAEDDYFGIQNGRKAVTGILAGLHDPAVLAKKLAEERRLQGFVWSDEERSAKWGDAWDQIAAAQKVSRELYPRSLASGIRSDLYRIATHLVRWSAEKDKPSHERLREYNDAALPSLEQQLFSPAPVHADLEIERIQSSLSMMAETLGYEDRLTQIALGGESPGARATSVVEGCSLFDVEARRALYEGGRAAVEASEDPMILMARALDADARALRQRLEDEVDGPEKQGYAKISAARFELDGESVYPDATFTLRLAFGTVKGWSERGEDIPPFTRLAGLYERSAERGGTPPFDLPQSWVDRKDDLDLETPYNFVSDCDIIGGNSGSPVVNRDGEVVGLIFDGNLHSLTLDIAYTGELARAVSVDSRAMIEAMRKVYDAQPLVDELQGARP